MESPGWPESVETMRYPRLQKVRAAIFAREVATLRFLERVNVPTPIVFDFALEGPNNPVGVGNMLLEKIRGRSCQRSLATPTQKTMLLEHLADAFFELSVDPFESMGSFMLRPSLRIGLVPCESLTDFDHGSMKTAGPCQPLRGYYTVEIQLVLGLIRRREMYAQQAVDVYLIHLFLMEILPSVANTVDANKFGIIPFSLKHPNDKGDHILVDDDFHITTLIDWGWAYTAPPTLAFNSPIMLFDVAEFYNGSDAISADEETFAKLLENKGRPDMAGYLKGGRVIHTFVFCCGYDLSDWNRFLGLFYGLRYILNVDANLTWSQWKNMALRKFDRDCGLQQLLVIE